MPLCPRIDVLFWDAQQVHVRCPYCEETHRHGLSLSGKRLSHCHPGGHYEFRLPIDEKSGLVGYEIDKKKARFVNVSVPTDCDEETEQQDSNVDDISRSVMNMSVDESRAVQALDLHDDAKELEIISMSREDSFHGKRLLFAIPECVNGNVRWMDNYFKTSTEKTLFLTGRNKTGDTMLIMAAAGKSHDMVSLLLKHGAEVNATNKQGRSPLLEAALWGRIANVRLLLSAGADKCLRDQHRCTALDLAQATRKNGRERYDRSSLAAAESVYERDTDRRHIVLLLDHSNPHRQHGYTSPMTASERNKYGFDKNASEMAIMLRGPIQTFNVQRITKTAAILDRGGQFDRISATSGWGHDALPQNETARPSWVDHVFHLASVIEHELPSRPNMDQRKPRQYYACHAEKKLIAYFIDRHVFLPRDKNPDQELQLAISGKQDSLVEQRNSSRTCTKLCDLEERRKDLNLKLFDADDRILGDEYDEKRVKQLQDEIKAVEEQILALGTNARVRIMRATGRERESLLKKEKKHQDLIKLSKCRPGFSLRSAVILSSNEICGDCESFKDRVNTRFGLNIEMTWRT